MRAWALRVLFLILSLAFFLSGCASQYRIQRAEQKYGASGRVSFVGSASGFAGSRNLIRWSYFWDPPMIEQFIRLPKDLGEEQEEGDLMGLKIQSYFTTNDVFLGLLPFVERRHFNIIYHSSTSRENSTREGAR